MRVEAVGTGAFEGRFVRNSACGGTVSVDSVGPGAQKHTVFTFVETRFACVNDWSIDGDCLLDRFARIY